VDLRDFASWLAKDNPFTSEGGEIKLGEWNKSLEEFLAALIRYQSGVLFLMLAISMRLRA
jgi:hypothetical protein